MAAAGNLAKAEQQKELKAAREAQANRKAQAVAAQVLADAANFKATMAKAALDRQKQIDEADIILSPPHLSAFLTPLITPPPPLNTRHLLPPLQSPSDLSLLWSWFCLPLVFC